MQFIFLHMEKTTVSKRCFGLVWASAMFFQEFFDSFEDDSMSPILVTRTCGEYWPTQDIADLSMTEDDFRIVELG